MELKDSLPVRNYCEVTEDTETPTETENLTKQIQKTKELVGEVEQVIWNIFETHLREKVPPHAEVAGVEPKTEPVRKVSELIREVKQINVSLSSIPTGILREIEWELKKL